MSGYVLPTGFGMQPSTRKKHTRPEWPEFPASLVLQPGAGTSCLAGRGHQERLWRSPSASLPTTRGISSSACVAWFDSELRNIVFAAGASMKHPASPVTSNCCAQLLGVGTRPGKEALRRQLIEAATRTSRTPTYAEASSRFHHLWPMHRAAWTSGSWSVPARRQGSTERPVALSLQDQECSPRVVDACQHS